MKGRVLTSVLVTTLTLGAMSLPSGASTPNAYALMETVIADADAKTSVHVVALATESGTRLSTVTDAGRRSGRQVVTLTSNGGSDVLLNELVAGKMYVRGDAYMLFTYMGLSEQTALELGNKWFFVPRSNADYAEAAEGLTISSGMAEITMNKSVSSGPSTTIAGARLEVVKGTSLVTAFNPATRESLYFTTATQPLPVEVTQSFSGTIGTITLSHWNEHLTVVAPTTTLQLPSSETNQTPCPQPSLSSRLMSPHSCPKNEL